MENTNKKSHRLFSFSIFLLETDVDVNDGVFIDRQAGFLVFVFLTAKM